MGMHIAKRRLLKAAQTQLGMAQSDYVAMLKRITGKDSSLKLDLSQINAVLNEFKRLGFTTVNKRDKSIKLIQHLWLCLGDANELRDPSKAAMLVYCNKISNKGLYRATDEQLYNIIESLKSWCDRKKVAYKTNKTRSA